jgi:hypothetical protein
LWDPEWPCESGCVTPCCEPLACVDGRGVADCWMVGAAGRDGGEVGVELERVGRTVDVGTRVGPGPGDGSAGPELVLGAGAVELGVVLDAPEVAPVAVDVVSGGVEMVSGVVEMVSGVVSGVVEMVSGVVLSGVVSGVVEMVSGVVAVVSDVLAPASDVVTEVVVITDVVGSSDNAAVLVLAMAPPEIPAAAATPATSATAWSLTCRTRVGLEAAEDAVDGRGRGAGSASATRWSA